VADLDRWLVLLHVLGAMVWLGAWAAICMFAANAVRRAEIETLRRLFTVMRSIGPALIGPSTLAVLATGIVLVVRSGRAEFADVWVAAGLGLYVAVTLVGMVSLSRASRTATTALDDGDVATATVATRTWLRLAIVVTALLVLATADMVLRP
jgi:uncharacterized membrane protein